MATWAEVVSFSEPLTARPSNAPEEVAMPMRFAPVMHLDEAGQRTVTPMRWGFTKSQQGRIYPDNIHARDDRLLASRLWRPHFEARRGVLIVNSFNEGEEVPTFKPDRVTPTGNTKTVQWTIRPKDGARLAIAVIYRMVQAQEGDVAEFVMCTTTANKGISKFVTGNPDRRMPAVLKEDNLAVWLGQTGADRDELRACLSPYEDDGVWSMAPQGRRNQTVTRPAQGDLF
jgi:putative SOS response-associated peptidase YedK